MGALRETWEEAGLRADQLRVLGSAAEAAANATALLAADSYRLSGRAAAGPGSLNDLGTLVTDLAATNAHFIRCIKPTSTLKPNTFEPKMVLEQLRCGGVFDAFLRGQQPSCQRGIRQSWSNGSESAPGRARGVSSPLSVAHGESAGGYRPHTAN